MLLLLLCFLFLPLAKAGFGMTAEILERRQSSTLQRSAAPRFPTLDYHTDNYLVQLNLLDVIASLPQENRLRVGGSGYYLVQKIRLESGLEGNLQLGFALDVLQDNTIQDNEYTEVWGLITSRLGVQMTDAYGIGLYIVPGVGWGRLPVNQGTDVVIENDLVVQGSLQISVWNR